MDKEKPFPDAGKDLTEAMGEPGERVKNFRFRMAKVTMTVFSDFLKFSGGSETCLNCGNERLTVPQLRIYNRHTGSPYSEAHAHYTQFLEGDGCDTDAACHEYSVICKRCGFTMKINAGVVLNWYTEQEKTDE